MNIQDIDKIEYRCTGCLSCVDICPSHCISVKTGIDGFLYTDVDITKCVDCHKCISSCPVENIQINNRKQSLFSAFARDSRVRRQGSSGGVFECLATHLLNQGWYICGAAFDDNLNLHHRIVHDKDNLHCLLKSKYVQSNMEGVYSEIIDLLKCGENVFFCGTPCQVSALKNSVPAAYQNRLLLADIICHGVPSQKMFDGYIASLEKKHNGKVINFSFRVKDNCYRHAHGFRYQFKSNGREKTINGIYTKSSYYYAFKQYLIFRNSCYNCQYATLSRVSDITLGDFWGIESYDKTVNSDCGVSMVLINSEKGELYFEAIKDRFESSAYDIQIGISNNHCLTHSTSKPPKRDEIIQMFMSEGYEKTSHRYFKEGFIYRLYWLVPFFLRSFLRKAIRRG